MLSNIKPVPQTSTVTEVSAIELIPTMTVKEQKATLTSQIIATSLVTNSTPILTSTLGITTSSVLQELKLIGQIGGKSYIWAVQGNYAYLSVGPRLLIFDISDQTKPVIIGQTPVLGDGTIWNVTVVEDIAYIFVDKKVYTFNISDRSAPIEIDFKDVHSTNLVIQGDRAYLTTPTGLIILDTSNLSAPTVLHSYNTVVGNMAYVADWPKGGLQIVDISDPFNPREVGRYTPPTYVIFQVTVVGDHTVYVMGEGIGIDIIDVSNPSTPTKVKSYLPERDIPVAITVEGNTAFIATANGLRLVDVSNPVMPKQIGLLNIDTNDKIVATQKTAYIVADNALYLVDISNLITPTQISTYPILTEARDIKVTQSITGRIYAYVACGIGGLGVIDVSDPITPTISGFFNMFKGATKIEISDNLAYIVNDSHLSVVDISNPSFPYQIGSYDAPASIRDMTVVGDIAYILAAGDGLHIVNVSDPTNPNPVGFYQPPGLDAGIAVAVKENIAYIPAWLDGLRLVDVSTPSTPKEVGSYTPPNTIIGDVVLYGNFAYVTGEDEIPRIVNVSNPMTPYEVGTYELQNWYGSQVVNTMIYTFAADNNLHILDISNPANPKEIGRYDKLTDGTAIAVVENTIYVTSMNNGLQVFSIENEN